MLQDLLFIVADENYLNSLLEPLPLWLIFLVLALSLTALSKGADWLIEGAVALAEHTAIPRVLIGATIISLGTTLPEAMVSAKGAWFGSSGLALGNAVGSVICNMGLIFGAICLFRPVPVRREILRRTSRWQTESATFLVILSLLALWYDPEGPELGGWVGFILLIQLFRYLFDSYKRVKKTGGQQPGETAGKLSAGSMVWHILGGLAGVLAGARMLVASASVGALRLGVPEEILAATLVAFGTSLPELVTAITAVRKGHPGIMVGNVIGANVLNCLFVLGSAAAISPLSVPASFYSFHFVTMLLMLYAFQGFLLSNAQGTFRRWQGAAMLAMYLLYLVMQFWFGVGVS
jgi:cation:H+ antiporter